MRKLIFCSAPALAVVVAGALSVIAPLPAQEAGASAAGASPEALILFQGGPLWIMLARTQTSPTTISESSNWTSLPNASLSWTVFPGTTALFNVSFSAECLMTNAAGDDWVRIRVLENGNPMEPYDAQQRFCSVPGSYTGEWAKRLGPGSHTITVQLFIVDSAPFSNVSADIDDWTLQLAAYQ